MKLMYPYFLWAFVLLLIPVVLHLFHLRRFKTLYFSNIQFLKKVDITSKSTRKIQRLLILLSRLLAFSFLILAFAQPYFPSKIENASQNKITCIYIDNSFSMQAMGIDGELLSQAKQVVEKIINKSNPDEKFLILTNDFSAEEQIIHSKADALDFIDQIKYSAEHRSMSDVIQLQKSLLKENNSTGIFYWISDGQKSTWEFDKIKGFEDKCFPVLLQAQYHQNISIDSVWFSSPITSPNKTMEINIKASLHGATKTHKALVEVMIDKQKQTQTIELSKQNSKVLKINLIAPKVGNHAINVKIKDEGFVGFDNEMFATFNVNKHENIGIINGANATRNVAFVYQIDSFFNTVEQSINQLNLQAFDQCQLLILNQVKSIEYGLNTYLTKFVKQGGTVVLSPSQDCDIASWNIFLKKCLLPKLQLTNDTTKQIQKIAQNASFFAGVFDKKTPTIRFPFSSNTQLSSYFNARYLPLLFYGDNEPFLCKSNTESEKIFLFNGGIGTNNTRFMQSDLFSTLFLLFAKSVKGNNALYQIIGKPGTYSVNNIGFGDHVLSIDISEVQFIPKQSQGENTTTLFFNGARNESVLKQGIFDIINQKKKITKIAFNYNRDESKTTYYSPKEIEQILQKKGFKNVVVNKIEQIDQFATLDLNKSNNIWRIMLILGIIFLLLEIVLLKVFKL